MATFYLKDNKIKEDAIIIEGKLYHHLRNVLRIKEGEEIKFFDEKSVYSCLVKEISKNALLVQIKEKSHIKHQKVNFEVIQATIDKNELELTIRLLVSIVVKKIHLFKFERSNLRIKENYLARLNEIALNTAEQSEVCSVPEITSFEKFEHFYTRLKTMQLF